VKDVVPALNQIFGLTLVVTAQIRFHHFDGVAAIEKRKIPKLVNTLDL